MNMEWLSQIKKSLERTVKDPSNQQDDHKNYMQSLFLTREIGIN